MALPISFDPARPPEDPLPLLQNLLRVLVLESNPDHGTLLTLVAEHVPSERIDGEACWYVILAILSLLETDLTHQLVAAASRDPIRRALPVIRRASLLYNVFGRVHIHLPTILESIGRIQGLLD